ncbi:MAG: DNA mismatch repair endonuclease MutL [Planctomycetes bacterium]|nr:DNA mismatch repair endonuclease MutL [Planctomycetota bacterium]
MPRIEILDENMINMIAAGEVIERPASVVKELLENSIDAGASKITVTIEDGGRKLIAVTDNACGIDAADLAVAFKPHATSKIKTSGDLADIATMGFRGEALASIASVSRLRIVSRTGDAIQANALDIDCGAEQPVKPCAGDYGTTIEIRNLFYKLPARRKFLRTANTEMSHIIEHFTRIALAHRNIDMTLIHNGRQIHRLLSNQSLKDRIAQLLSRNIAEDLLETESSEKDMHIFALLGTPAVARGSSKFQYVFLNRRFIRDRFIGHAVKEAYRGLIEHNKYPVVFLFLELAPNAYDVNVHPTKIEVRFQNANLVHSQVLAVLREKLLNTNLDTFARLPVSPVDLSPDDRMSRDEQARRQRITQAMADFFKTQKPEQAAQQRFAFTPGRKSSSTVALPKPPEHLIPQPATQADDDPPLHGDFLQLHNSYIVTQTDEGFVIIDQHALHERIIYEDLCRKTAAGRLASQRLLIPETLEIDDAQADAIGAHSELISRLGIELVPFGPKTIAIQAFPAILAGVSPADFVGDMLDRLTDKSLNLDAERLLHELLDMTACKAAIKAGQSLTNTEMAQLLADKQTIERASHCPHGRPTTIKFTLTELEKQFKRT